LKNSKLNKILTKAIQNEASEKDLSTLKKFLKKEENRAYFISYIQADHFVDKEFQSFESDKALGVFFKKVERKSIFGRNIRNVLKYAAVFLGIISLGYYLQNDKSNDGYSKLIIEEEVITLQMENGELKTILSTVEENIVNKDGVVLGKQKGNKLEYSDASEIDELVYNELTVPYGKTFELVLSDGTNIYLNAGTSIKYPIKFIKGLEREVFLKGEAYFDVAENLAAPFTVHTNEVNVRVLGTEFNVSTYPEDDNINTVLVEGAVSIYEKGKVYEKENAYLLTPGYKAEWSKVEKNIAIEKTDPSIYTGWIHGKLTFKNLPFKVIRKKLERRYNVTIINKNKKFDDNFYNINFDIEDIPEVIETFSKAYNMEYSIEDNQIIIN